MLSEDRGEFRRDGCRAFGQTDAGDRLSLV